jgi:molybdenum cofactor cytidylyltransferase
LFEGIVLAAGRSSRAGTFKPGHLYRGGPLLHHAVDSLQPWCRRVVVVAGFEPERIAALIAGRPRLELAINQAFDDGMFSSVKAGARALGSDCTGFFVLPADCPLVGSAVPGALVRAFLEHDRRRAVVPVHTDRGGHPVLLPSAARALIMAAAPPATLRTVIACLEPLRLPVDEPAVLMDLDTPQDLAALGSERPSCG